MTIAYFPEFSAILVRDKILICHAYKSEKDSIFTDVVTLSRLRFPHTPAIPLERVTKRSRWPSGLRGQAQISFTTTTPFDAAPRCYSGQAQGRQNDTTTQRRG